jgi:hypothetical protein
MYYLKPKTGQALGGGKENLPLVLLWGDRHRDDQAMCKLCYCSKGGKHCCYRIYDGDFLKELDVLASVYPVDFYTEYSEDMPYIADMNNPKNILFHRFLNRTTHYCHQKGLRSEKEYERKCPTRNIRWHYADARAMEYSMEYYAFSIPTMLLENLVKGESFQRFQDRAEFLPYDTNQSAFMHKYMADFQGTMLSDALSFIPPEGSSRLPLYEEGWSLFLEITGILLFQGGPEEMVQAYVTRIMKNEKYSVIYKQLKKCPSILSSADNLVQFMVTILRNTAPRFITMMERIQALCEERPPLRPLFMALFQPENIGKKNVNSPIYEGVEREEVEGMIELLTLVPDVIMWFENSFVIELYTLFRMLKPPKESSGPFLVMGYFGTAHVTRLAQILQLAPYFDYEVIYQKEIEEDNAMGHPSRHLRCITIDTPVYLARDLKERAEAIRAYPEYERAYRNYRKVILAERLGRSPPSPPSPSEANHSWATVFPEHRSTNTGGTRRKRRSGTRRKRRKNRTQKR